MDIAVIARKWALQNAVKYEGRANPGAVISKLLGEHPELKAKMNVMGKTIAEVVASVNSRTKEQQLDELQKTAPELLEEKPKVQTPALKPLKDAVEGKVVMRFAPSPSGPLHIGHIVALSLNSEYCVNYDGKLILRIEDTNSDNIFPKAYDMIPEDANWLTSNNVKEVVVQSSRLEIYYKYAEQLIEMEKAYICTCDSEVWKELSVNMNPCPCRSLPGKENLARWRKMFRGYKEGEAVMRIKTDLHDKNPAMRDWPAFRINDSPHPMVKDKRVWPLMNFSVAIDDHEFGITHSIRGKDHVDNEKRQQFIFKYFDWVLPITLFIGRINFTDLELSTTQTKLKIEQGEYSGWDDIRLPFIRSFKRRGYQPAAFRRMSVEMGVSLNDKTVSREEFFKIVNAFNKELIDDKANRYFFVANPVEIVVKGAPEFTASLMLHPDHSERGYRSLNAKGRFFIAKEDAEHIKKGDSVRLIECMNIGKNDGFEFVSREYDAHKDKMPLIHWLPVADNLVDTQLFMPDGSILSGKSESAVKNLKVGDIIQFERMGFCRLDSVESNTYKFWFAHR